jgi:23S rRNA (guanosine2251-2'-O)-methyltransferase
VIVYGRNPVREAMRGPRDVTRVWATARAAREPWLSGAAPAIARPEEIERRCGSPAHQGICAEVGPFTYADAAAVLDRRAPLLVALDGVEDPQNLGAICRTAECAGADAVVLPERRAAAITAAVCKASAGAVEHVPVARVRNLADFLVTAKEAGCWCYGAAPAGRRRYDEVDWTGGTVIVLGAEGRGLRARVAAQCDELVAIPLRGRVESLNAAAAAAVLIYAAALTRSP